MIPPIPRYSWYRCLTALPSIWEGQRKGAKMIRNQSRHSYASASVTTSGSDCWISGIDGNGVYQSEHFICSHSDQSGTTTFNMNGHGRISILS